MIPDGNCAELLIIFAGNWVEPLIIPLGKFANTFAASVTSALASIASNLFFNVVVKSFSVCDGREVNPLPSPANDPVKDPVNGSVNVSNCVELLIIPLGNCAELLIVPAGTPIPVRFEPSPYSEPLTYSEPVN